MVRTSRMFMCPSGSQSGKWKVEDDEEKHIKHNIIEEKERYVQLKEMMWKLKYLTIYILLSISFGDTVGAINPITSLFGRTSAPNKQDESFINENGMSCSAEHFRKDNKKKHSNYALAERTIETFLATDDKGENSDSPGKFFIQGWRWHTLSLNRDSDRLVKYAKRIHNDIILRNKSNSKGKEEKEDFGQENEEQIESLKNAVTHVIDFNLKGLQRIENDIFFPWLREKLIAQNNAEDDTNEIKEYKSDIIDIKKAFEIVIDDVDCDRKHIENLATKIRSEIKVLGEGKPIIGKRGEDTTIKSIENLAQLSQSISYLTKSIRETEDRLLVPAVAKLVPAKEQKSFNNKVLRNLGLFESRIHLVGMHDTVYDKAYASTEEQKLFVENIPSVARMMIERWRGSLYEPKAGMLSNS